MDVANLVLRAATDSDRIGIEALLRRSGLPIPDRAEIPVEFLVAGDAAGGRSEVARVLGCAGWELHDPYALLRSIAVAREARGKGAGSRLAVEALRILGARGRRDVYLVTLDRERFFARLGFVPVSREEVPPPVRESPEYRIHECAGGTWMRREA